MPNQIVDFGKFVVWRFTGEHYATQAFICSHGGYDDNDGSFTLPDYNSGAPEMLFYGPHGEPITVGRCNHVIAQPDPKQEATAIAGPGSNIWNYRLSKFPSDWFDNATVSAKRAKETHDVNHDIILLKDQAGPTFLGEVIGTLDQRGIRYLAFHFMACRSTG